MENNNNAMGKLDELDLKEVVVIYIHIDKLRNGAKCHGFMFSLHSYLTLYIYICQYPTFQLFIYLVHRIKRYTKSLVLMLDV